MVASLQDRSTGVLAAIPLQDLADNPDNPRTTVGDIEELARSVAEQGVLEPVLVAPATAYAAARPQHTDALAGRTWVLLAGHRRRAAAAAAGLDSVPAIVRDDLDGPGAIAVMFTENFHRQNLTPLEEASTFALLRELGLTQTAIATRTGCSQGHVSKRLSLLTLPDAAQEALRAGQVQVNDALALAALAPEDQHQAWRRHLDTSAGLRSAVDAVTAEGVRHQAESRLREQVQAEGLDVVEADVLFGEDAGDHQLRTQAQVDAAREDGALVVDVTDGRRRHYRRPDPRLAPPSSVAPPDDEDASDEDAASPPAHPVGDEAPVTPAERQGDAAERVRARRRRSTACAAAARARPSAATVNQALLEAVLHRVDLSDHAALRLAAQWTSPASADPADLEDLDDQRWLQQLREAADPTTRRSGVWALVVAARELRARATHRAWDALDVRHLQDLEALAGYSPTDWELARLDEATGRTTTTASLEPA